MPLKQIDAVGHRTKRVFKVSIRLTGVATLHRGDGGKIKGIGGSSIIVLDLDFSQALIIDHVGCHDAVTQSVPVDVVLLGTGGGMDLDFVVDGGAWRFAAG